MGRKCKKKIQWKKLPLNENSKTASQDQENKEKVDSTLEHKEKHQINDKENKNGTNPENSPYHQTVPPPFFRHPSGEWGPPRKGVSFPNHPPFHPGDPRYFHHYEVEGRTRSVDRCPPPHLRGVPHPQDGPPFPQFIRDIPPPPFVPHPPNRFQMPPPYDRRGAHLRTYNRGGYVPHGPQHRGHRPYEEHTYRRWPDDDAGYPTSDADGEQSERHSLPAGDKGSSVEGGDHSQGECYVHRDEYTKIQTPRQEVLFKRSCLEKSSSHDWEDQGSLSSNAQDREESTTGEEQEGEDFYGEDHEGCEELCEEMQHSQLDYADQNGIFVTEPGKPPLAGVVMQQAYAGGPMISIPVHWTPFLDPSLIAGETALTPLDPAFTHIVDPKDMPIDPACIIPMQHDESGCPITVQVKVDEMGHLYEIEPSAFTVNLSSLQSHNPPMWPLNAHHFHPNSDQSPPQHDESAVKNGQVESLKENHSTETKDSEDCSSDSQYASMSETSTAPTSPAGELSDVSDCHHSDHHVSHHDDNIESTQDSKSDSNTDDCSQSISSTESNSVTCSDLEKRKSILSRHNSSDDLTSTRDDLNMQSSQNCDIPSDSKDSSDIDTEFAPDINSESTEIIQLEQDLEEHLNETLAVKEYHEYNIETSSDGDEIMCEELDSNSTSIRVPECDSMEQDDEPCSNIEECSIEPISIDCPSVSTERECESTCEDKPCASTFESGESESVLACQPCVSDSIEKCTTDYQSEDVDQDFPVKSFIKDCKSSLQDRTCYIQPDPFSDDLEEEEVKSELVEESASNIDFASSLMLISEETSSENNEECEQSMDCEKQTVSVLEDSSSTIQSTSSSEPSTRSESPVLSLEDTSSPSTASNQTDNDEVKSFEKFDSEISDVISEISEVSGNSEGQKEDKNSEISDLIFDDSGNSEDQKEDKNSEISDLILEDCENSEDQKEVKNSEISDLILEDSGNSEDQKDDKNSEISDLISEVSGNSEGQKEDKNSDVSDVISVVSESSNFSETQKDDKNSSKPRRNRNRSSSNRNRKLSVSSTILTTPTVVSSSLLGFGSIDQSYLDSMSTIDTDSLLLSEALDILDMPEFNRLEFNKQKKKGRNNKKNQSLNESTELNELAESIHQSSKKSRKSKTPSKTPSNDVSSKSSNASRKDDSRSSGKKDKNAKINKEKEESRTKSKVKNDGKNKNKEIAVSSIKIEEKIEDLKVSEKVFDMLLDFDNESIESSSSEFISVDRRNKNKKRLSKLSKKQCGKLNINIPAPAPTPVLETITNEVQISKMDVNVPINSLEITKENMTCIKNLIEEPTATEVQTFKCTSVEQNVIRTEQLSKSCRSYLKKADSPLHLNKRTEADRDKLTKDTKDSVSNAENIQILQESIELTVRGSESIGTPIIDKPELVEPHVEQKTDIVEETLDSPVDHEKIESTEDNKLKDENIVEQDDKSDEVKEKLKEDESNEAILENEIDYTNSNEDGSNYTNAEEDENLTCKQGYVMVPILTPYYDPAVLFGYPMLVSDLPQEKQYHNRKKRKKYKKRLLESQQQQQASLNPEIYTGDPFLATPDGYIPMDSQMCQMHGFPYGYPGFANHDDRYNMDHPQYPPGMNVDPQYHRNYSYSNRGYLPHRNQYPDNYHDKHLSKFSLHEVERKQIAQVLENKKNARNLAESSDSGVSETEEILLGLREGVKTCSTNKKASEKVENEEKKPKSRSSKRRSRKLKERAAAAAAAAVEKKLKEEETLISKDDESKGSIIMTNDVSNGSGRVLSAERSIVDVKSPVSSEVTSSKRDESPSKLAKPKKKRGAKNKNIPKRDTIEIEEPDFSKIGGSPLSCSLWWNPNSYQIPPNLNKPEVRTPTPRSRREKRKVKISEVGLHRKSESSPSCSDSNPMVTNSTQFFTASISDANDKNIPNVLEVHCSQRAVEITTATTHEVISTSSPTSKDEVNISNTCESDNSTRCDVDPISTSEFDNSICDINPTSICDSRQSDHINDVDLSIQDIHDNTTTSSFSICEVDSTSDESEVITHIDDTILENSTPSSNSVSCPELDVPTVTCEIEQTLEINTEDLSNDQCEETTIALPLYEIPHDQIYVLSSEEATNLNGEFADSSLSENDKEVLDDSMIASTETVIENSCEKEADANEEPIEPQIGTSCLEVEFVENEVAKTENLPSSPNDEVAAPECSSAYKLQQALIVNDDEKCASTEDSTTLTEIAYKGLGVSNAVKQWIRDVTPEKAFSTQNDAKFNFVQQMHQSILEEESSESAFELTDDESSQLEFESYPKNVYGNPLDASASEERLVTRRQGVAAQRPYTPHSQDDYDGSSSISCLSRCRLYSDTSSLTTRQNSLDKSTDDEIAPSTESNNRLYDPKLCCQYYQLGIDLDATPVPSLSSVSTRSSSTERASMERCLPMSDCETDEELDLTLTREMSIAQEILKSQKIHKNMRHTGWREDISSNDLPMPTCGDPNGHLEASNQTTEIDKECNDAASTLSSGLGSSLASTPVSTPARINYDSSQLLASLADNYPLKPAGSRDANGEPVPLRAVCCAIM